MKNTRFQSFLLRAWVCRSAHALLSSHAGSPRLEFQDHTNGLLVHTYDPSTQEAETGRLRVQSNYWMHSIFQVLDSISKEPGGGVRVTGFASKSIAATSGNLSSIPRHHKVEREKWHSQVILGLPHAYRNTCLARVHIAHTEKEGGRRGRERGRVKVFPSKNF